MRWIALAVFSFALLGAGPAPDASQLQWRFIGPLRGGRTTSITGVTGNPNEFYIGVVNGGVWKTQDAGRTWKPIFDGEPTGSIGALAVAASDPRIVYAGSGEGLQRPDLAVGDGIYKSTDAGATWTHLGLRDGQQIGSIAVDPGNPNRLFVAVLGHPYGPNDQRGIYRSIDGGANFTRVLFKNADTGAYDVVLDPHDPQTVYATLWAARQAPWEIGSSFEIPGSGMFKSSDGGSTWQQLTNGLPAQIGRAEIAPAPSDSHVVYAYADTLAEGGSMYRSDDGGAHFTREAHTPDIAQRGDDLVSIAVDPRDTAIVYLTNTSTYRSSDGGKTFAPIKGAPGGDDYHTVWLNPQTPGIIGLASDQGATISVDGGATWSSWYNQPTAQMYHANADDRFPYFVCGGQQESGSACVSSRGNWGEVTQRDWETAGAQEYGYVVPDPLHAGIFYGGKVERFTERTGQVQEVSPIALPSKAYRVIRTEPLAFDRFDKRRLYFGSNVVWQTSDGGLNWKAISPDLTREHPAVPAVVGAFESNDPEHGTHRGVTYALAPSYRHEGTLWAGTDDGYVWITRDGGAHWSNITPPGLTAWSKVAQIDASRVDDDTAFVAVTRFRLDDLRPYAYVTHDGGRHWQSIVSGLPDEPVNAVRQDPLEPHLLYAATENGVYYSLDSGARWQSLQLDLPHTSVRDLIVHGNDVIVATHGRGFWILDDVAALRDIARNGEAIASAGAAHLFAPQPAYRVRRDTNTDTPLPPEEPAGQNPPDGAIFDYYLPAAAGTVAIVVTDATGATVRRYVSNEPAPPPIPYLDKPPYWERPWAVPGTAAGMHRFVWDLREPAPRTVVQDLPISAVPHRTPRLPEGPLVVPGTYNVRLEIDGRSVATRPLTLVMDPRVNVSATALARQFALARELTQLADRAYEDGTRAKASGKTAAAAAFEDLNLSAAMLLDIVDASDSPPTQQSVAAVATLRKQVAQAEAHPPSAKPMPHNTHDEP